MSASCSGNESANLGTRVGGANSTSRNTQGSNENDMSDLELGRKEVCLRTLAILAKALGLAATRDRLAAEGRSLAFPYRHFLSPALQVHPLYTSRTFSPRLIFSRLSCIAFSARRFARSPALLGVRRRLEAFTAAGVEFGLILQERLIQTGRPCSPRVSKA